MSVWINGSSLDVALVLPNVQVFPFGMMVCPHCCKCHPLHDG